MTRGIESAALVALLRGGCRPWQVYADLVEEAGSALAVLEREDGEHGQQSLFDEPRRDRELRLQAAADQISSWQRAGMRLITVLDPDYPENLRAVHDRPPLIFVAGRLEPDDARSIAVVGTRSASPRGTLAASAVAGHLVHHDYTVVSGLAAGIDTAAHTAALARNGRTVAVIGTGLTRAYPPQNAALQRGIASQYAVI